MALPTSQHSERDQRLDEAIAEYLEAVDAGRRPDAAEWLARFPDLGADLNQVFAGQQQVGGLLVGLSPQRPADSTPADSAPADSTAEEPEPTPQGQAPHDGG